MRLIIWGIASVVVLAALPVARRTVDAFDPAALGIPLAKVVKILLF
jgi:hypothetical protein